MVRTCFGMLCDQAAYTAYKGSKGKVEHMQHDVTSLHHVCRASEQTNENTLDGFRWDLPCSFENQLCKQTTVLPSQAHHASRHSCGNMALQSQRRLSELLLHSADWQSGQSLSFQTFIFYVVFLIPSVMSLHSAPGSILCRYGRWRPPGRQRDRNNFCSWADW